MGQHMDLIIEILLAEYEALLVCWNTQFLLDYQLQVPDGRTRVNVDYGSAPYERRKEKIVG